MILLEIPRLEELGVLSESNMGLSAKLSAALVCVLIAVACGSGDSAEPGVERACTAGQSVACTGAGGCRGGQVCGSDGTYGSCECSTDLPDSDAASSGGVVIVDAGNDGDATPQVWTPARLSGLLLWAEGRSLVGTQITDWPDQSSGAHHLLFLGPPQASAPLVHAGAINGLNAATFVGGPPLGAATPDFALGSDAFTIEIVLSATSSPCPADGCHIIGLRDEDGETSNELSITQSGESMALNGQFEMPGANDRATLPLAAGFHVVALRRIATGAGELRVDGTTASIALSAAHVLSGVTNFRLGEPGMLGPGMRGDIAEIVFVRTPSNDDVTQLESYLKSKYAL